jgi:hypothetical protein
VTAAVMSDVMSIVSPATADDAAEINVADEFAV